MADGHPWLARTLDVVMRPMYPARRFVVPEATGTVLEVGVGTGLNFGLYRDVTALEGVDPDPFMLARARERVADLPFPVRLHQTGAERMPFADGHFDTAVVTFTLCTIPDPAAALAEVHRVLRAGGRLLFVEHTRSIQPLVARRERVLHAALEEDRRRVPFEPACGRARASRGIPSARDRTGLA